MNVSILSARGTLNGQDSERQIRSGVFQLLRNLFPAGEIHVDDASLQRTDSGSVPERAAAPATEPTVAPVAGPAAAPVAEPVAAPVTEQAAAPVTEQAAAPVAEQMASPVVDDAAPSNGPSAAEANVTEEGIFLSNLLHQIIPVISHHTIAEPDSGSTGEANTSEPRVAQDSSIHVSMTHKLSI